MSSSADNGNFDFEREAEAAWTEGIGARCSRRFLAGPAVQPRYAVGELSVCAACALICVPEGLAELVASPLEAFECEIAKVAQMGIGVDALGGGDGEEVGAAGREGAFREALSRQGTNGRTEGRLSLISQLQGAMETRRRHELPEALACAKRLLPLRDIREKAFAATRKKEEASSSSSNTNNKAAEEAAWAAGLAYARSLSEADLEKATSVSYEDTVSYPADSVCRALLNWFKGPQFFRWLQQPEKCVACGAGKSSLKFSRCEGPSCDVERSGLANRVEVYGCESCGSSATRYPRYNNAVTLLTTSRSGRCGEFANAFTLMCRAAGFEARYVLDVTDHVWTEIWSAQQQRWLHADSCEKKLDRPQMYSRGWGKKIIAVFAFDRDSTVHDVTRRYLFPATHEDYAHCLLRRYTHFKLDEANVQRALDTINETQQHESTSSFFPTTASQRRRDAWASCRLRRRKDEIKELATAVFCLPERKEEQEEGRQAGDADWIAARGEGGTASEKDAKKDLPAGSWRNSARAPKVAKVIGDILFVLSAELRTKDGDWAKAEVLFLAGGGGGGKDDLANDDGRFDRSKEARQRLFLSLAQQLRSSCENAVADPPAARRRYLKLAKNLREHPGDPKFRSLKLSNAVVQSSLLAPGDVAHAWLRFALGFQPSGTDILQIPATEDNADNTTRDRANAAYDAIASAWPSI